MSKAILVMDMPDSCMGCNFLYCDAENNSESCQAREKSRIVDLENDDKPDWCPLREMPEKLPLQGDVSDLQKMLEEMRRVSWNACIDAIGGGDD